jgi:hypothetical protein
MPNARISHALIVAGPSGAGKSTFLRELAADRLAPEIRAHLPSGAAQWREVCGHRPREWQPLLQAPAAIDGIALHYDTTLAWQRQDHDFKRDPVWQVLNNCAATTWVEIRPPSSRLIAQWCRAHMDAPSVAEIRLRQLGAAARVALSIMRPLRRQIGTESAPHWRYPRPLRFLKQIDLKLRAVKVKPTDTLDFYRHRGNIEQLMQAWDKATVDIAGSRLVKRIELVPDLGSRIGTDATWRVSAVQPADFRENA